MPKHARKKKDGRALRPFLQAPTAKAGRSSQTINHILYFIGRGNWFLKESLGKAKIKEDMVFKCIGGRADNHVLPRRHQVVRWLLCWFWHQYHDLCAYQRPWATAASVLFGSLDSTGFLAKPSSVVHLLGDGSITNVWMLLLVLPLRGCITFWIIFPPTPHQLLWLFCDPPPSHGGINFWIILLYFLCGLPLPSRSDTSAQPPQLRFIPAFGRRRSLKERMDKAARLQVLRPAHRGDAMPFICEISYVCQARVRSAEFSMIIVSRNLWITIPLTCGGWLHMVHAIRLW